MSADARRFLRAILAAALGTAAAAAEDGPAARDPRNVRNGLPIPDEGYCDQPYVVVGLDGRWLCVMTTGKGHEGQGGQHVVSTVSADRGRTWSPLVDIEPADGPEASWAVPLLTPAGRVYAFYDYNGDRVDTLRGKKVRADMLGWYVFKHTDDFGATWSRDRVRLPMRATACDRGNDWQGGVQIFWGICKPQVAGGEALFAFSKLGKYMLEQGEGWVYRSPDVLTEPDPGRVRWELLPDGDRGIRGDAFGSVQEEHNLVWLGGTRWYCVYRTTRGHPCHTTSDDGGRRWEPPAPMTYAPGGRVVRHPRACPKVWRTADGRFLFWFHNHGGKSYDDRNPAWIAGGVLKDGRLHWSQPEILLYDPDPKVRLSYPDLIEQDGRFWVTETQKEVARVHAIDRGLLERLWRQGEDRTVARQGLVFEADGERAGEKEAALGKPVTLRDGGLTLECRVALRDLAAGQVLLDGRDEAGRGVTLVTGEGGAVRLELADGEARFAWDGDRGTLKAGAAHHVAAIVDAGPRIVRFVIDGVQCDGAEDRPFGWGRYDARLDGARCAARVRLAPSLNGELTRVRIYDRPLLSSEAVANFNAAP